MMLGELSELLSSVPVNAVRDEYRAAIVEQNLLGKDTVATRRSTNQRLGELYSLDRAVPIFRMLRCLWALDEPGRPLLALLCALARDPLLRASVGVVVPLPIGGELIRGTLTSALRDATGTRLNESILDKVARNAASSWAQSGHLNGRVRKVRRRVDPTPGAVTFALWLGSVQGFAGEDLFRTEWAGVLDRSPAALLDVALKAKQLGWVRLRTAGGVVEVDLGRLDSARDLT
jgi:hypothetical protein